MMKRKGMILSAAMVGIMLTFAGCNVKELDSTINDVASNVAETVKDGVNAVGGGSYSDKDLKEYKVDYTKVDSFKSLDLETQYADVEIIPSEEYAFECQVYYLKEEPTYGVSGETLTYTDEKSYPKMGCINLSGNKTSKIKVYLPKSEVFETIKAYVESGELKVGQLQTKTCKINDEYGDIEVSKVIASSMEVQLSSGNLSIDQCYAWNAVCGNEYGDVSVSSWKNDTLPDWVKNEDENLLKIKMSSGNLNVEDATANEVSIGNEYGGVDLSKLKTSQMGISISSGACKLEDIIADKIKLGNEYGDVTTKNVQCDNIKYNLSSGNCKLDQVEAKQFTIDAEYGDVKGNDVAASDFEISISSGDCDLASLVTDALNISSEYGKVAVGLKGARRDYNYDVKTDGDIVVGTDTYEESFHENEGESKKIKVRGSESVELSFEK